MIDLLEIVIHLGNAKELGSQVTQSSNQMLGAALGSASGGTYKGMFQKCKFEAKKNQEGGGNNSFPKKKTQLVDLNVAEEKETCFKCGKLGHFAKIALLT